MNLLIKLVSLTMSFVCPEGYLLQIFIEMVMLRGTVVKPSHTTGLSTESFVSQVEGEKSQTISYNQTF